MGTLGADVRLLLATVSAVPGVASASLEADGRRDGAGSLRLNLYAGVDEPAAAAAVNRVLRSGFQLMVDPAAVTLTGAVAGPAGADGAPASSPVRLSVQAVQVRPVGERLEATVRLGLDGGSWTGTVDVAAAEDAAYRAIAAAAARAVEGAVLGVMRLSVERVEVSSPGSGRTALVVLTVAGEGREHALTGSALVRDDVPQAVIRATLAAVNRRIEPLLARSSGS